MSLQLHFTFLLTCALFFLTSISVDAQSTGDYRSVVNGGNWGTAATWETFNGTSWIAASAQPGAANNVTIRNGFDVLLDASGKNCLNLTIENGAAFTAGVALPTSSIRYVRINGTTVTIDGTFGSGAAPGDAVSLENANNGGTIIIAGTGTFAPARVRVNSNASGTTTVFDMDAKFMYTGSSGTGGMGLYPQTDSNTFIVNAGKTVAFADYSNIGVGSSIGSVAAYTMTLIVNGTLDLSPIHCSATLKAANGKTAALSIGPNGSMTVGKDLHLSTPADSGTTVVSDSGSLTVGGIVDLSHPSFAMTGPGTFTLAPGGGLLIGSPYGLDSANGPIRTQTRNLPVQAAYTFNNTAANQFTGADLPDHVYALIINNASDTVSLTKRTGVDHLTVAPGAAFKVIDTLTIDSSGTINGTLANAGAVIAGDTLAFMNGSCYMHQVNGGTIPLARWDSNSTCRITGLTGKAPSNGNQNFYHLVWDCPMQSSHLNLGWNGNTIQGDITVISTGSSRWQLCAPAAGTENARTKAVVTMNGAINQTGGDFTSNGSSNGFTDIVIHTNGNVNVFGGNFSVSRGSQGGTGTTQWYLHGDVSMSNATMQNSNAGGAKFIFANAGVTKLKFGPGNSVSAFPMQLQNGATLDLDTSAISGNGALTIDSGATVMTKHAKGLDGNMKSTGKISLSPYANFEFNGSGAQTTGMILPDTINDLGINNAFGITLTKKTRLQGGLKLIAGKLSLGPNMLEADSAVGGSSACYVVTGDSGALKLRNIGGPDAALFPVGTETYTPLMLKNEGTADHFTVRVQNRIENSPVDSGKAVRKQWRIEEETAGGTQAQVSFEWNGSDEAGSFRRGDTVVIGKYDGNKWTERIAVMSGSGPYRATIDTVTSFSDWAIGNPGAFSDEVITGNISTDRSVPLTFSLAQNYPNPFNPSTTIRYSIAAPGKVSLTVYTVLGQKIADLVNTVQPAGWHETIWNANAASGIYFYRIDAVSTADPKQRFTQLKKMTLLK